MRTPSWKTDSPCGVPSSGDAAKPRKLTSGWKSLPLGDPSVMLFAFHSRNGATPVWRSREIMRDGNDCTL